MVLHKAKQFIETARSLLVLTGAGISAESGVPTFRGGGGAAVWRGMPFEELSSARMVRQNLPLVWDWFDYRRSVVSACEPNAGHIALAEVESREDFEQLSLVTQNIDNLHCQAGSKDVIELHGNIHQARCRSCGTIQDVKDLGRRRPPVCSRCGDLMRPNVVLFGEYLPVEMFERAMAAAANCDACLVVGTSALVAPASTLPGLARRSGSKIIEINPEMTQITENCDISIRGTAAQTLPALFNSVS